MGHETHMHWREASQHDRNGGGVVEVHATSGRSRSLCRSASIWVGVRGRIHTMALRASCVSMRSIRPDTTAVSSNVHDRPPHTLVHAFMVRVYEIVQKEPAKSRACVLHALVPPWASKRVQGLRAFSFAIRGRQEGGGLRSDGTRRPFSRGRGSDRTGRASIRSARRRRRTHGRKRRSGPSDGRSVSASKVFGPHA